MKQRTVKTIVETLNWIKNNAHHKVEIENLKYETNEYTHFTLSNYHERLRIPVAINKQMEGMIEPNKRPFDTRMYSLTRKGREYLKRNQ